VKKKFPPKRRHLSTPVHGIILRKGVTFINILSAIMGLHKHENYRNEIMDVESRLLLDCVWV